MSAVAAAVPADYDERVYAGVLGKIIAVYLGRPFEGWTYERIMADLGEITGYVNHRVDLPLKNHLLVVTDDDITGTFLFPRVLTETARATAQQVTSLDVGNTWLNHIIEGRTALWWGGLGNSTEHTAYLRMKAGVRPPDSGSIQRNGLVVAEQVGAQIFVEGLAMTCPGDPVNAADLAETSARVSHDGEAINAARVVAALVSQAFVESDIDKLLDTGTSVIPADCLIRRVIDDVRGWAAADDDWHRTRAHIADAYGYDKYGGNCHVVPNHAVVIAALAHSGGAFDRAMTVVHTSGWDTDSNGGDVGSVCGVFGGLTGLSADVDWRGPVADRLYLPGAQGGAVVTDAVREALVLSGHGRRMRGQRVNPPKGGARFHFSLPGSVQGFAPLDADTVTVGNDSTGLRIDGLGGAAAAVLTPTFIPPNARDMRTYELLASPTLYPGQTVRARVAVPVGADEATVAITIRHYDGADELAAVSGPSTRVAPGGGADLEWRVPDVGGQPIVYVGVAATGTTVTLDRLGWTGAPDVSLGRPEDGGTMWRRAWVDAVDRFDDKWGDPYRIVQNRGRGLLLQGSGDWDDYRVSVDVTPHVAASVGLAARVQGLRRYYALELVGRDHARLLRVRDDEWTELGRLDRPWSFGVTYRLALTVDGSRVAAWVDGQLVADVHDPAGPVSGAVALMVEEGRTVSHAVRVRPVDGADIGNDTGNVTGNDTTAVPAGEGRQR